MTASPEVVVSWIFGGIAAVAAGFERFKSGKMSARAHQAEAEKVSHDAVLAAKDELAETMKLSLEQWKTRFNEEHGEYKDYREKHHKIVQDIQTKILTQAEEIATLKARTDMTPLMDMLERLGASSERVASTMERVSERLERLENRRKTRG